MNLVSWLPHLNAGLNGLATVLLIAGYLLIRRRHEVAHRRTMLACFAVSCVFLVSYLTYHGLLAANGHVGHTRFPSYPPAAIRSLYYFILLTHIVLAALVPVLAIVTIVLGLREQRMAHRRWARWTFPIWLYVSVTGVAVYLLLYQIFPPRTERSTLEEVPVNAVETP